jgi:hypothetical protein
VNRFDLPHAIAGWSFAGLVRSLCVLTNTTSV